MTAPLFHAHRRQPGFSMVELMVALAIGSVLTLVVAQLFQNTRSTNRAQEEAARMQENTRFALATIARTVRLAGYTSDPTVVAATIYDSAGPPRPALAGTDAAAPGSDTLTVRFQGGGAFVAGAEVADNTVVNCLGTPVLPDYAGVLPPSYNKFSISQGADLRNALFCQTTDGDNTAGTELVSGIEAMQVLFGEDTSNPADSVPNKFVRPSDVGNASKVVAVRVYLLISGTQGVRLDNTAISYPMAGETYAYPAGDMKLRRVATTTVTLRNRVP